MILNKYLYYFVKSKSKSDYCTLFLSLNSLFNNFKEAERLINMHQDHSRCAWSCKLTLRKCAL